VHWTGAMIAEGTEVARSELQPGDLVFPDSGHVQMYVGDGQVIEAPHTGASVRQVPIYGFWHARRVATDSGTATNTGISIINPLDVASIPGQIQANFASFSKFFGSLTTPNFWFRFGYWSIGAFILLAGLLIFFWRQESKATQAVGRVVGGVGSTVAGTAISTTVASRTYAREQRRGISTGSGSHTGPPVTPRPYIGRHAAE
jgi:hypothetical protein